MNMKKLEDFLPHLPFMRVHRSFIVNMTKVEMIDRGRIIIGSTIIPVSESYKISSKVLLITIFCNNRQKATWEYLCDLYFK